MSKERKLKDALRVLSDLGMPRALLRPAMFSARDPALFEGELRLVSRDEPGGTRTVRKARRSRTLGAECA